MTDGPPPAASPVSVGASGSRPIVLSFDLEEFDLPLELGGSIDSDEQMRVGREGLEAVLAGLQTWGVRATFFTTAHFADHHQTLMRELAQDHEVASHGYYHSRFEAGDLARSKRRLEEIVGRQVRGFRRPRFAPTDRDAIEAAGYTYSSSENPIWLPGRYNRFFNARRPYLTGTLLNIPVSATPVIRFPLFWLSVKNLPAALMKPAMAVTLGWDGDLNLFFHPWEFTDLSAYDLPRVVKRRYGREMLDRLARYIAWLKDRGTITTFAEYERYWRRRHGARQ